MTGLDDHIITCLSNDAVLDHVDAVNRSCIKIFGHGDREKLIQKLQDKQDIMLHQICDETKEVLAFKLGYAESRLSFYSWLGGVVPEMRGRHLARELMIAQHAKAKDLGYEAVTTRTQLDNHRMSAINISAGFRENGIMVKEDGRKLRCFMKSLQH